MRVWQSLDALPRSALSRYARPTELETESQEERAADHKDFEVFLQDCVDFVREVDAQKARLLRQRAFKA